MKIDLVDKSLVRSNTPKHAVYSVVVNTFFQVSRPRPRPLPITSGDRDLYACEDLAAKIHAFFTQSSTQYS